MGIWSNISALFIGVVAQIIATTALGPVGDCAIYTVGIDKITILIIFITAVLSLRGTAIERTISSQCGASAHARVLKIRADVSAHVIIFKDSNIISLISTPVCKSTRGNFPIFIFLCVLTSLNTDSITWFRFMKYSAIETLCLVKSNRT